MKVTKVFVRPIENSTSKVKAFVEIELDKVIRINNFKLIDGVKGLFIGMPSEKKGSTFYDLVKIADKDLIKDITKAVLKEYGEKSVNEEESDNEEMPEEDP